MMNGKLSLESTTAPSNLLDIFTEIDAYDSEKIAIEDAGQVTSYGTLRSQSRALAIYLQKNGFADSSIMGICLDRSVELIVGLMGILRAGHAYLPLDPHYPKDRLQTMIEVAECKTVLCHRRHAALYQKLGIKVLIWEDILPELNDEKLEKVKLSPASPAYVIFTSGSTGKPKGVVLGHGALAQLLHWHRARYPLNSPRALQFTPISFDVSFQEIFSTLHAGGTLVLIQEDLRLDPIALLESLEENRIQRLFLPFVALQFLAEAAVALNRTPKKLVEVFTAGEALKTTPALRSFFKSLPDSTLHNHYGPSETHVITAFQLPKDPDTWAPLPSIGQAIDGSFVDLLNSETLLPVSGSEEGELFLGGKSLAEGYIHRPDLTAERFIQDPHNPSRRLYRTGDMGRRDAEGNIDFLGRRDGQIKIRGHRIELGEVEAQLGEFPGIGQLIVDGRTENEQVYLVAYYLDDLDLKALKDHAAARMPEAMRPTYYVKLSDFPRTPSGKIDRKALPSPFTQKKSNISSAPTNAKQSFADIFHSLWAEILPSADFHADQNFMDAGGTSLLAMRFVTLLKQRHNIDLRVRDFFARPTINSLVRHFSPEAVKSGPVKSASSDNAAIAIVGMAVDAPGAANLESFWDMLIEGREGLLRFSEEELEASPELQNDPHYVPVRGVVENPEGFDNEFFAIGKREAELIDPQQRRLLQLCWQSLEDAGLSDQAQGMQSGVFVGTGYNTYLLKQIMQNPKIMERAGDFQVMLANDKDYAATRVAYKLNLKGPALSIHTACSTSLVAVVAAVQSLRRGECDIALAGAMSIQFPSKSGHIFSEGGILSKDGHCRPYDADASGTLFCDGGGIVTLKRLDDAIADGDRIYSIIRGAAWNNDGSEKASFSAPSLDGQSAVIRSALHDAKVSAADISYVEGHGTATPIGDPLEWEALRLAFEAEGATKPDSVIIGSVKGNIGHTTASAGVLGLIKTSLGLYHQKIPGTMHFQKLNSEITQGPFSVSRQTLPWLKGETKRMAGVSSFGVGGTNAHVVIEGGEVATEEKSENLVILTLSHRTPEGLERVQKAALQRVNASQNIEALAAAYGTGRKHFNERSTVIVKKDGEIVSGPSGRVEKRKLVWAFPGQGAQLWNMGRDLHANDSLFRTIFDELNEKVLEICAVDLKASYWLDEKQAITNTKLSQLGLFAVGYALGQSLLQRGIKPAAVMGHSVGEWVAATLSGVFKLDDAIRIIGLRGSLMEKMPDGAMLSVRSPLDQALALKPSDIDLAASNAELQQVFSGPRDSIEKFSKELLKSGIVSRLLEAKHAFHSRMVDPICEALEAELLKVEFLPMEFPIVSTVTGEWLKDSESQDPKYWSRHARVPVKFHAALETVVGLGDIFMVEMGPRSTLVNLSRKLVSKNSKLFASLGEVNETKHFANLLSEIWITGLCRSDDITSSAKGGRSFGVAYEFLMNSMWIPNLNNPFVKISSKTQETAKISDQEGSQSMRIAKISEEVRNLIEESSGEVVESRDDGTHFMELGLDSLFLTQFSLELRNKFKVEISFRQLMEELGSVSAIAEYVNAQKPEAAAAPSAPTAASPSTAQAPTSAVLAPAPLVQQIQQPMTSVSQIPQMPQFSAMPTGSGVDALITQQLHIMQSQLALLGGQSPMMPMPMPAPAEAAPSVPAAAEKIAAPVASSKPSEPAKAVDDDFDDPAKKVFGAMARISKTSTELGARQQEAIEAFRKAYNEKTKTSKARTQEARSFMADPRVVTGFKPALKETIYPILVNKSKGAEVWDIDGNKYVDMLNGFGSSFFGWSPEFITKELKAQIDDGYELGPQHPLALEASKLAQELTGFDRVAWCNTGSEAVLGAMRIARTVTGRTRIASFTGSYHGINDEVILRGSKSLKTFAAAPGIMSASVQNMLVLDYGTEESLKILRENCKDLAAVLVEPAQSRRPDFRPLEFLKEVRKITEENGTVLIFDEVITGFRYHSGGFQTAMGIRADIGTYGKVVGGGMPIGMIAGKRKFMDALDGGHWQYGDQSIPEVGVTYFAGTFVRHPLALRAAVATMRKLKEMGPELHLELNRKADKYCADLNATFKKLDAPYEYANFGSLMKLKVADESSGYPELLCTMLRHKGVHIWDGFPTFVTTAHTQEQLDWVVSQFALVIGEMKKSGLLGEIKAESPTETKDAPAGARLGRTPDGRAAWYVADPENPGQFKMLEETPG